MHLNCLSGQGRVGSGRKAKIIHSHGRRGRNGLCKFHSKAKGTKTFIIKDAISKTLVPKCFVIKVSSVKGRSLTLLNKTSQELRMLSSVTID